MRIALVLAVVASLSSPSHAAKKWTLPITVKKLPNGLTVVFAEDHSSPTVGLCVEYGIGWRREPRNRTGFAHLFEHMMFEGTPNAPKGVFSRVVESAGGLLNGSTRDDNTNYISTADVGSLDAILWLEADRMRTLDFSEKNLKNQQQVVKEEVRVNVKNEPYDGFYWRDMSQLAWSKWESQHDGYGSFQDLEAARVEDVQRFFADYYGPNNAVLAIVGDFTPAELFARVEKYFAALPARPTPAAPNLDEPLGTGERTLSQVETLAPLPAVAEAWRMPPPGSPDQLPAEVLAQLLYAGDASRLYRGLVKGRELVSRISGSVGFSNGLWYRGPSLLSLFAIYKPSSSGKQVIDAIEEEVRRIAKDGVPAAELQRVKTKMTAEFYSEGEAFVMRAAQLADAQWALGDARRMLDLPTRIDAVTSDQIKRVAATYLIPSNRSWIDRRLGKPVGGGK